MSVSKWKWTPECDRGICVGDCDLCDKAEEIEPKFGEWIPIKKRPMSEEERQEFEAGCDWVEYLTENDYWFFDCAMPDDGQDILITTSMGYVRFDTCINDDYGLGLEERDDWDNVIAWMPLPEPYKMQNCKE